MVNIAEITGIDDLEEDTDVVEPLAEIPHNVGHLLDLPVEFLCPACEQFCHTNVKLECVTILQKIVCGLNVLLCCQPIKWSGRHDVNHYCSKCGCFIGRKISLSWYKRTLFRLQRSEIEDNNKWQRFRKIQKQELDDKKMAKQRAAIERQAH